MSTISAFPIAGRWPAKQPKRLQRDIPKRG